MNKETKTTVMAIIAIVTLALALAATACGEKDTHTHEWEWQVTTPATATADGLETETCKTCGAESGNTRIIEQTEPTVKTFNDQVMFTDNGTDYLADIIDARTQAGRQTLEQLGIVTRLQGAVSGVFTAGNNIVKNRFRGVFQMSNGGITIYVDNPATFYKAKAPNGNTIYIHIDYLSSLSDADLQTAITSIVQAMNPVNPTLPFEITNQPATITQTTTPALAFDGTVTITTGDLYLDADWNAVVAQVIAAFNAAYTTGNNPHKTRCETVFGNSAGAKIVLVNDLANNWEVRDGEFGTLYLKTGSIATATYSTAVARMAANVPEVGKAKPPKGVVFFIIV